MDKVSRRKFFTNTGIAVAVSAAASLDDVFVWKVFDDVLGDLGTRLEVRPRVYRTIGTFLEEETTRAEPI